MWEIRRSKLIKKLTLLDLIQEKVGLSSSEFFRIRGKGDKVIISTASYAMGEVTIIGKGKWPSKHSLYIDRRVFLPFIYASKEIKNRHPFRFTVEKASLNVQHGSRSGQFLSQNDVKGYGSLHRLLKEKESSIPVSDDMLTLLRCGQNCAVSDAIEPKLNCVFVDKGRMVVETFAASARMYFMGTGSIGKKDKIRHAIPFPLTLIPFLSEESLKKVCWRGKCIVLEFEDGYIWQEVSQEALDKFPIAEIRKNALHTKKMPVIFTVSSRRLSKLMVRLGYYLQKADKKDWVVKIRGKKRSDSVMLSASIPGVRFEESVSIVNKLDKDVKINWPLDCLKAVFQFLSTKTKKLGLVVRMDKKQGVSYITAGNFWFTVTSKQEK